VGISLEVIESNNSGEQEKNLFQQQQALIIPIMQEMDGIEVKFKINKNNLVIKNNHSIQIKNENIQNYENNGISFSNTDMKLD